MFRTRDPQLLRRAAAARAVLPDVEPEDRPLLLSLVCWPPAALLVAERAAAEDEAAFSAAFDDLLGDVVAVL
jgi:hypothetical protein